MKNRVLILLSTYNGEKYIALQLDSLLCQKDVHIDIMIRDDGSSDNTTQIINEYVKNNKNISLFCGQNIGYARSFWDLLQHSKDNYDYYAFCDQDDIWDENKIIKAIEKLKNYKNIPSLYTSRVTSVNNAMQILNENTFNTSGVISKYDAFQKSVVPGCVFVFNNSAKQLLSQYNGYMESHDWTTYAIINAFGKIIYDNNSYIKYRIHESNTIGKKSCLNSFFIKVKRFFKKSKCSRSRFANDFLNTYSSLINDENFKKSIKQLAYYKKDGKLKLRLLFNKNFKGVIFKIYVILNKI